MASNDVDEGYDTVDAVVSKAPRFNSPNKRKLKVDSSQDDIDEGFDSPSLSSSSQEKVSGLVTKVPLKPSIEEMIPNESKEKVTKVNSEQPVNADLKNSKESDINANKKKAENVKQKNVPLEIRQKAESLAVFIMLTMLGKGVKPKDKVDEILLQCVTDMMTKHEIKFKGMMNRLNINKNSGYQTFVAVANEIFEGNDNVVNWGRVIALYSFAGQLALYCKENKMEEYAHNQLSGIIGRFASEKIAEFVANEGGWVRKIYISIFRIKAYDE